MSNGNVALVTTFNLEQQQKLPTRADRVLDLFCTNKPGLTKSIHVIPGLSDHEIVCVDCDLRARINKKPPRKIHLWSKADWAYMKQAMVELIITDLYSAFRSEDTEARILGKVPSKIGRR